MLGKRGVTDLVLNNVCIGQCQVWAREAQFDMFFLVSSEDGKRKREKEAVLPVVRVTGKGVKNVRVGSLEEGKRGEGEKMRIERKVEVRGRGEESKVRRVGEGVAVDGGVVVT